MDSFKDKFYKGIQQKTIKTLNKETVHNLLQAAKNADKDLKVFGASSHKYQLNPVTTLDKVQEFEKKYGLKLPEAYVKFLTEIGNGGAGPDYGLYSLEKVEAYNSEWLNQNDSKQAFIDENMTPEMWKKVMDECEDEDDDDKYDEILSQIYTGILIIGTQGCTFDTMLMCKGSEYGKIVYIDWNLEGDYPPYLTGMTFEEWYMCFFEEIANGKDVRNYGYYCLGNEDDLIKLYTDAASPKQKKKCIISLSRFSVLSQNTIDFLMNIKDKDVDSERLYTLLRVSNEKGMLLLDKFLAGENKAAASERIRLVPDNKKDKYYHQMLTLLYEEKEADKESILFFLSDCNCRCAADIVKFVMDDTNPENLRRTAIWLMGKCKDVNEYIDEFITLMKNDSYWLVHSALQAAIDAGFKCQKIMECYEWLAEKYKDNSMIRNNLSRVLKTN